MLAAGEARRFGSAKQLAVVDGEPMVARVTRAALSATRVDRVVVVVGARAAEVSAALPEAGERVARCAVWADGIGASLACGLAAAGPVDAALILLGDQPLVDRALIDDVIAGGLAAIDGGGFDAARPVDARGAPGHPVLLGPAAIALARTLTGDTGALARLDRARIHTLPSSGPAITFDIDEPADLVVARALIEHGAGLGGVGEGARRAVTAPRAGSGAAPRATAASTADIDLRPRAGTGRR